jgi:hypothetical protein
MKLSEYFHGLGDAIADSGHDRDLTDDELHDLHSAAESMTEPEANSAGAFLMEQGSAMDGWSLPIGVCIIAAWKWIKSWF